MFEGRIPHLTFRVELPGGQSRLREASLYVMTKRVDADAFGLTELNETLWRADFTAYAARRVPVTGRQYVRMPRGPAPFEMYPLLQDMWRDGDIRMERHLVGQVEEHRPVALVEPGMRYFSPDDLSYLDAAIEAGRGNSGRGAGRDPHGVAWQTRGNGDPMPYDLALLSDETLAEWQVKHFTVLGKARGWQSD